MPTNARDLAWDVVVIGFWNPAILTPAGIAYRLLKLPKDTPVQVEVPLDGLAPYRVRDRSLVIMASPTELHIAAETSGYENLNEALKIASTALNDLPETPVRAAGFNIRYCIDSPPDNILRFITSEIDDSLSDEGYEILSRILRRSLKWRQGNLNIELSYDEQGSSIISLNFDRQTENIAELIEWIKTPIEEIKKTVDCLLEKIFKINVEEIENEKPEPH